MDRDTSSDWGQRGDWESRYERLLIEEMVALLRHDLRNKLGAVRNASFYLQKSWERVGEKMFADPSDAGDSRVGQMFGIIKSELAHAEELLRARVLTAEETVGESASECELGAVARELVATLPAAWRERVDLTVDEARPFRQSLVSRVDVGIAIYCLVRNAFEAYAGAPGRVAISVGGGVIEVRDEAGGFEGEAAARHLEPLFTTRVGHVGLGLNIARRVASRARGELQLAAAGAGLGARLTLGSAP